MILDHIESVEPDALAKAVKTRMGLGWKIVTMFVSESDGNVHRTLWTLMRKDAEVHCFSVNLAIPEYGSVATVSQAAVILERNLCEMSGVTPIGHPSMRPSVYWRKGEGYPLQKEPYSKIGNERLPIPANDITGSSIFEIPVGPVHAGVIDPGHFRFSVAGEPVLSLNIHLGYTHRGIEKMLEGPVERDRTRLIERVSGDTAVAHTLAYARLIEGDAEIPVRAEYLRVVLSELERIYNHLDVISGLCTDTAFSVPAAFGAEVRERIFRLNESAFGHRFLMGNIVPGGVRRDITLKEVNDIEKAMMQTDLAVVKIEKIIRRTPSEVDRQETTGILKNETAVSLGVVGPIARASGIATDVRTEMPYGKYKDMGINVASIENGDVFSRGIVRMRDIRESVSLILRCLSEMEKGPVRTAVKATDGMHCSIVEAPRGELAHMADIRDGEVWRYHIRDPSVLNWRGLEIAAVNNIVPDFPLINKSFGQSYSGNDL